MKTFFKNNLYPCFALFFIYLLFLKNTLFKQCIINGSILFFENVFPSLFPMFIINDILMNYNFFYFIEKTFHKFFKKIFNFSPTASYVFIMSMFSGTPTNAYIISNLVKEKRLTKEDASVILSYSCFLNPLFLYNMLNAIFLDKRITIKIMIIHYSVNFLIALFFRKYPYEKKKDKQFKMDSFSLVLSKSLKRSADTLFLVLGTILFYFIICEGITIFFHSSIFNCFLNGILETTGGLAKLKFLNINFQLKQIFVCIFINFTGFSIHSQIKNITNEEKINFHYFFLARIVHALLSASIAMIIS